MKTLEEELFERCFIDEKKLLDFGFIQENDMYIYHQTIMDDAFEVIVYIKEGKVQGKIIELAFQEEYTNFRVKNHRGKYNLEIKEAFMSLLQDIKDQCTTPLYFINSQTNRIASIIEDYTHDKPIFFFEDSPDCGVFKNRRSGLWYGIVMEIDAIKLGEKSRNVEIINLKLDEKHVENLLKRKGYYPAYHSNKKYWISVILDETLDDEEIMSLVKESYHFSEDYQEWIIPISGMNHLGLNDTMSLPVHDKIKEGSFIYFYDEEEVMLTYKVDVVEVGDTMTLKVIDVFKKDEVTFKTLQDCGLKNINKLRKLTKKQKDAINGIVNK